MGAGGVAEFFDRVGGQVLTVREQRSNRDAMAAPRAAWESVRRTTLATLMSRADVGWDPKFGSTAPPETPSPRASNFPRGVALRAVLPSDTIRDVTDFRTRAVIYFPAQRSQTREQRCKRA